MDALIAIWFTGLPRYGVNLKLEGLGGLRGSFFRFRAWGLGLRAWGLGLGV